MSEQMNMCNCGNKSTPLIFTFAFPGAEYWCPYCGGLFDIFGSGHKVEKTPELEKELTELTKSVKEYLSAKSTFCCESLMYEGERIKPRDLPKHEIERRQNIIKNFKRPEK